MPPADQAPVVERHWCLRILPTLQWTVLGILVLVTAVFYEDVNAMRLAARAAVLGPKATEGVGVVHETEAGQVASNQLELGRKGGPKAPVLTAPPAPDSAAPVPMAGRTPKVSVVPLDKILATKDADSPAKDADVQPSPPPPPVTPTDRAPPTPDATPTPSSTVGADPSPKTQEAPTDTTTEDDWMNNEERYVDELKDDEPVVEKVDVETQVVEAKEETTQETEAEAGEKAEAPSEEAGAPSGEGTESTLRPGGPVPLPNVPDDIGGEWRSIGKTQPLTGEDLSAPGALEAAAEKRSFRKEIIVMVANEGGAILAANAVANLRSVGIEHYMIVTNEPKSCELLMNGPWGITCGYTSYLKNHERLAAYNLLDEEGATPFRLWWVRFHFLDRLVQLGYNPMYIDTDVSFRVNPYPLLKGPFAEYTLFAQDETNQFNGVNIGWIYAQNARPDGRVRWVLNQTVTRMMEILEHKPEPLKRWDGEVVRGAKEALWDQHIYNDVLESCVYGKDMRRRSMQRQIEPVDELRSKWEKDQGYPMEFAAFDEGRVMVSAGDVPVTARGDKMRLNTGSHSVKYKELLCYDHFTKEEASAAPEKIAAAPPWLVAGWSGVAGDANLQGLSGNWNLYPPRIAVAHFVGGLAKQTTFKSLGWWQYGSDVFRKRSLHGLQTELDRGGALAVHGLKAGNSLENTLEATGVYGAAVANVVRLALAAGRRPVVPALDCTSKWMKRGPPGTFLGVKDRMHVVVSGTCDADSAAGGGGPHPAPGGVKFREPGYGACCQSVQFDCNEGVIPQIDLDRDPRFEYLQDDVAYVKVDELLGGGKDEDGFPGVDGAGLQEKLAGPALLVVELGESTKGFQDGQHVPGLIAPDSKQSERIYTFFKTCRNMNCVTPRTVWPNEDSFCDDPNRQ